MLISENIKNPTPGLGTATANTILTSISSAREIAPRPLPKPTTLAQKLGLRYERQVLKALKLKSFSTRHNPWYEYIFEGDLFVTWCVPDIILDFDFGLVICEVKLTYTPEALEKLQVIYCPVISVATSRPTFPLVIVKNALRANLLLKTSLDLYDAVQSPFPIYQWIGRGPIQAEIAKCPPPTYRPRK